MIDPADGQGSPAPSERDVLQGLAADVYGDQNNAVIRSMSVATKQNPDLAAQAQQLGSATGVGADVASRNIEEVRRQQQLDQIRLKDLARTSPALAAHLSDPSFAAVAHDDVQNLMDSEKMWDGVRMPTGNPVSDVLPTSFWAKVASGFESARIQSEDEGLMRMAKRDPAKYDQAFAQWQANQQKIQELPFQGEGWIAGTSNVVGQQVYGAPRVMKSALVGATIGGTAGAVGGLGIFDWATIPAGIIAGGSAGAISGMATNTFGAESASTYFNMRQAGYEDGIATPIAYAVGAVNAGLEMGGLELSSRLTRKAFSAAVRNIAGEKIGATVAKRTTAAITKETIGKGIGTAVVQGGLGTAAEATEEVFQNGSNFVAERIAYALSSDKTKLRKPQELQQFISDSVDTFFKTIQSTALLQLPGMAAHIHNTYTNVRRAESTAKFMSGLMGKAVESKLRTRSPETFQRFMAAQADGTSAETLYVEASKMEELLDAAELPSDEENRLFPGVRAAIAAAKVDGGDISFPTAKFVTDLAGTKLGDSMVENMRLDPNAPSLAEAREIAATAEQQRKEFEAQANKILEDKQQTDATFIESAQVVKDRMRQEVLAAGEFTPEQADELSTMGRNMIVNLAAKAGMTPEQYEAKYGRLQIFGERQQAATAFEQAAKVKAMDADYIAAIERGDTEALQRMVDDAAYTAGYTVRAFHGTDAKPFDIFGNYDAYNFGDASYFSPDRKYAEDYAYSQRTGGGEPRVLNVALKLGRVFSPETNKQHLAMYKKWSKEQPAVHGYFAVQGPIKEPYGPDGVRNLINWEDQWWLVNKIREAGFDSFTTSESDGQTVAYGVLNANQIKLADPVTRDEAGNVVPLSRRFDITSPRIFEQAAVPASLDAVANVESAFAFAGTKAFKTNREFKQELQDRVLSVAKDAGIDLSQFTPEVEQYLVRVAVADAITALRTNPNAVGWYNEKVTKALRLVSLIHPEVATDPRAKFAFTWALAVTSNGLEVNKNFQLAERVYREYKQTGQMPTNVQAGQAQIAINASLGLFNELVAKYGIDAVEKFMTTKTTVKDVMAYTNKNVSGENLTTEVYGAAALGPKIGNGFFANLYGHFEQLTMDRWLMRTWGRWTGTLLDDNKANIATKRKQLTAMIRSLGADDKKAFETILGSKLAVGKPDDVAVAIQKASIKPANRIAMAKIGTADASAQSVFSSILGEPSRGIQRVSYGDEMRKLGNALAKYLDGQKEAPSGPPERARIRGVMSRVLAELQTQFPSLTMSDLQALLWYPEKRLYDAAKTADEGKTGYDDNEAPDYANAAANLARTQGITDETIASTIRQVDDELATISVERAAGAERGIGELVLRQAARDSDTGTFQQSAVAPGFYSALERSIGSIDANALTGAGWRERLKGLINKGAIKQEELTWSGLEDFLALPREGKVTKAEVVEFLKNNGVRVETVTLGDNQREAALFANMKDGLASAQLDLFSAGAMTPELEEAFREYESMLQNQVDDRERSFTLQSQIDNALRENNLSELHGYFEDSSAAQDERAAGPKFSDARYQLPGGTNYREILLTLPIASERATTIQQEDGLWYIKWSNGSLSTAGYSSKKFAEKDLAKAIRDAKAGEPTIGTQPFTESHWDQPNVVAHIRVNDRVDANGKRILFVEEIQSDWGQKGRDKGFQGEVRPATEQDVRSIMEQVFGFTQGDNIVDMYGWDTLATVVNDPENAGDLIADAGWSQKQADKFLRLAKERKVGAGIVAGPFVTKTEGWLNLALKQIMLEAIKGNYDSVAFVNGEQSADRYNLAKQVSLVSVNKQADGRFLTYIEGVDGTALIRNRDGFSDAGQKAMTAEELEATVGKEVAKQAIEGKPNKDGWVDVRGDNLRVGGEGMKAFYDKIVPAAVNKLLKKVGGEKLSSTDMQSSTTATQITMSGTIRFASENDVDDFLTDMSASGYEDLDYGRSDENELEVRFSNFNQNQFNDASNMYGGYNGRAIELNRNEVAVPPSKFDQLGFDVTDAMRETVSGGLPLFQAAAGPSPRGAFDPRSLTLMLKKGADMSTFPHEMSHFYLTMLGRMASSATADPSVRADMDTLLSWFGVAGATPEERIANWNAMSVDQQRQYHEQFAYSFELYLFEGKSPSLEMQGVFDRFAAYLKRVYKSIRDELNATYKAQFGKDLPFLTPEIRGVMDRMLASDEQIKRAEAIRNMMPMFQTQEQAGMSDTEWAAYQAMQSEATQASITDLSRASIRQMQWLSNARSRILREMQAEHDERRKEIKSEVSKEVAARPAYRATRWFRSGEFEQADGTVVKTEGDHKINKTLAFEIIDAQPRETMIDYLNLPTGIFSEEGANPDEVAQMMGFTSGDQMLRALVSLKPMREEIDAETDRRLTDERGELNTPQAREAAIASALHNEARARFVATELRFVSKATQPVRVMLEAARQVAAQIIGDKKLRDLKPNEFMAAESRAAKDASNAYSKEGAKDRKARYGNVSPEEVVVAAKRAQLMQNQLAAEATRAGGEVVKAVKYLRNVLSDANRKRMGAEAADQIANILERFELRPVSREEAQRRASLAAWIQARREADLDPEISPEVENEAFRVSYRDLTVQQFRDVVDAIKQIEYLAKNAQKLLVAARKAEFEAARDEIVASIETHAGDRKAVARTPTTKWGKRLAALKGFAASHLKAAAIVRILDGGVDGGPLWEYLIRTSNERSDMETTMRAEATKFLSELFAPLFKMGRMGGAGIYFPTIDRSLNREARIAIALNMGNAGNIQRLLDGEGWSMEQIQPVLESLTQAEWEVVQGVWDYMESYRPKIAEKERRIYGKEPAWVKPQALTVKTAEGNEITLRGGYYPIKYDPVASMRSEKLSDAEAARRDLKAAHIAATTRRSFTKARVEEADVGPLLYSLVGMYSGINDVIHDLSWHEWLIDANRLMRSDKFDNAVRTRYGADYIKQLKDWIKDVAAGENQVTTEGERMLSWMRQNVSAAGLGFNLVSAAMQVTGFTNSFVRVGTAWVGRGIAATISNPKRAYAMVADKSEFMRNRSRTQFRELNELRNMVQDQSRADRTWRTGVYFLMMRMQQVVDVPTWIGAYEKALFEGREDADAAALADQAVIDSQGGGQLKDLSKIERGGPGLKLFTVFYSFMNTVYNQSKVLTMTEKNKGKLAARLIMLWVVPVVLNRMLKDALTPSDDDDDYWRKLPQRLAEDQLSYFMGSMVGVREFSEIAKISTGGKAFGYTGPSGVRKIGDVIKFAEQVSQGEFDTAFRKTAINLLGDLSGAPSAQINRTIDGIDALIEGKTSNPLAPLTGFSKNR